MQAAVLLTLAPARGVPLWVGCGTCSRGWVLTMQDQGKTGLAQMRHGRATVMAMGAELSRPLCLVLFAEVAGRGEGLLEADCGPAHLGHQQGKRDPARELLAPIYGWFTEGVDTADLREAQALPADLPVPG